MKSKSVTGKSAIVRVSVRGWLALAAWVAVMPVLAQVPAVVQVPVTNRVAGGLLTGYNGDSGSATGTYLSNPSYSVFDTKGNQYISDTGNNCVRRVDAVTNTMSVVAGYEKTATSPDTCNAAGLKINHTEGLQAPTGLAVDTSGNLYIADSGHNCVRQLPFAYIGSTSGSSHLKPVVDSCTHNIGLNSYSPSPAGIFVDGIGDLVVAIADKVDDINQVIFHAATDPTTKVCDVAGLPSAMVGNSCLFFPNETAYVLNSPSSVVLDPAGNFFLSDTGNSCVRAWSAATGLVSTPLGQCASDGTGAPLPNTASFSPTGLVIGDQGYLYVANQSQGTILQTDDAGTNPLVIAGIPGSSTGYSSAQNGIAAVDATIINPTGLSLDPAGNVNTVDTGHGVVVQLPYDNGFPAETLGNTSGLQTLWFEINSAVNLTATSGTDFQISNGINTTCGGQQTPSTNAAPNTCKVSVAFQPSFPGERRSPLTLSDSMTTPATPYQFGLFGLGQGATALFIPGTIHTVAPALSNPLAVVTDTTGDTFFAEAGASAGAGDIQVIRAGSQTPTVFVPAGGMIQTPAGLAVDSAQNLYVADSAANSIFKVDASGNVTTFASGLSDPVAVVVDTDGNLYVAQDGSGATDVLKIYAGGQQVVIAGLGTNAAANGVPAAQAKFVKPSGLYMDANGTLYVSDELGYRVYDIDLNGYIHFVAGNGTQTNSNPTIPTGVGLQGPSGLVGDAAGDIYIADGPGHRIEVVVGGQTPGIDQIVGTGTAGNTGDGGAANMAELDNPVSVALDGYDDLYLVDTGNNSLRMVNYQKPTLNFGYVKEGTTAGPLSTTLWNSGNENLGPLSSFLPADNVDFALTASNCGGSLLSGATCGLSYTFTPASYGSFVTTATSNAPAINNPQVVTLEGISPQPSITAPNVTAVYGTAYTLTATVTTGQPGAPAPTGSVTFTTTNGVLCTVANIGTNGVASCSPSPTFENVGGYPVTASYSGDANYAALTANFTLTITPAPVTITAGNFTRPYNTPNPTFTGTITGVVAGQSITDMYSTTATQTSAPGSYPITPANPATAGPGTLLRNYAITYVNGTLTITQNSGGVSIASPAVSAVYGTTYTLTSTVTSANSPAPTGTVSFTVGGQALCTGVNLTAGSASCSPSPTLENVGTYTVAVAYSGDAYYPAANSTISLTITPAPVTITAGNASRPYDTPNPTFTGTVTGVVAGQSITATYATTAVLTSPPGNYPITPTAVQGAGTLLTNYSITLVNGTLTITQASGGVTVTAPPVTAVYGTPYTLTAMFSSQAAAPTGSVTFTLGGQVLCASQNLPANGVVTCSPLPTLENVGGYGVTVSYSGDGDYAAENSTIPLTITPAPVMITAANATRPYDTANPVFTGTVTGVVAGQSITASFTTTAVLLSPPGTYPIVPTATAGNGTMLSNYNVTLVNGTLTVTQAAGAVSIAAANVTAVYGTAYTLTATLSAGTPPTGSVTFTAGGQTLCTAAVQAGTASCSPSPILENANTYAVTVAYSGDANYPASATTLTLTITPAPVTITAANATRPQNTPNPVFTGTVTGTVAGQSISATFSTVATQASDPGTYPIVPAAVLGAGVTASNYTVTLVNGILTITAAATGPTSPVGNFTISATPPEQEIDLNGTVNYPVTITSAMGFTDSVSFSCSGLPAGAACAFTPGLVTPKAGGTASTVMTIEATVNSDNVPSGSFGYLRTMPMNPARGPSNFVLAWTMLPFGFGGSAVTVLLGRKRRGRSGKKAWLALWLVPVFLLLAGLSGCSSPNNYKIYTVTITATDNTYAVPVAQSTTVELVLAR